MAPPIEVVALNESEMSVGENGGMGMVVDIYDSDGKGCLSRDGTHALSFIMVLDGRGKLSGSSAGRWLSAISSSLSWKFDTHLHTLALLAAHYRGERHDYRKTLKRAGQSSALDLRRVSSKIFRIAVPVPRSWAWAYGHQGVNAQERFVGRPTKLLCVGQPVMCSSSDHSRKVPRGKDITFATSTILTDDRQPAVLGFHCNAEDRLYIES